MDNKHNLTEEQLEAKKVFMKNLEAEIKQIQYDIEHIDEKNRKIKALRRLKYTLTISRLVAPYIVTAGLAFGFFAACGKTPFYTDDCKKYLEIKKTFDSMGNIHSEEQFNSYGDKVEYLTYYGKWEKNKEEDLYEREIRVYPLKNITEEMVYEIFDNIDDLCLDSLLGGNFSIKTEKKNRLNEDELEAIPFIEANLYTKDKNQYVIVQEELAENIAFTVLWFLLTYIAAKGIDYVRTQHTSFNYYEIIRRVKEKYPLISEEKLNQLLEIKMSNYKRLTR